MTAAAQSHTHSRDAVLANIVDDWTARLQAGEAIDLEPYEREHPELAERLQQLLPALQALADLGASIQRGSSANASTGTTPDAALAGTLGDYRIIREVGRGGMGVVYEAEQISLRRRVALKVLPFAATLDARQLQRFKNEAQAAACLHHTNIVPIFAVGQERGVHFYAMQFIEGQTLAEVIAGYRQSAIGDRPEGDASQKTTAYEQAAQEQRKDTAVMARESTVRTPESKTDSRQRTPGCRWVAELGIQAAEALEHAHLMGIVHRDVKPANLMVDSSFPLPRGGEGPGGSPRLWITDFGLAQVQTDTQLTMSGDLLGTLRYMSPEQALAKRVIVDHRTDIYSLGVTLYELLTLQPAFDGKDRQEILRQIAFEEPRALRKRNKHVPAELETIVLKAMEKDPHQRYATMRELADDLRAYLLDRAIKARRPSIVQKTQKWMRRHRPVVGAGLAVLLVLVLALAAAFVLVDRHNAELADKNSDLLLALEVEKEAKKVVQAREAETQAVLDFVENKIFAAARPEGQEGGLGHNVTLRKAIETALAHVDRSFQDQPLVEARLRHTLGKSFFMLGDAKAAAGLFEKARQLRTTHLGLDHRETLVSTNALAVSYHELGLRVEAIRLHEDTLVRRKATLGPDHADTLMSMRNLTNTYIRHGRYAEAVKLSEEVITLSKDKLGPDHPDTLTSVLILGNAKEALGLHGQAIVLYEETLGPLKTALGPEHQRTLELEMSLANCYSFAGRGADALKLRTETLERLKTKLGPDHPTTLGAKVNLAISHRENGRFTEAIKLYEEALPVLRAKMPYHEFTFVCMNRLAETYAHLGQHAEALKLRTETLELMKAKLGPDHPTTLGAKVNLGVYYAESGRFTEGSNCMKRRYRS